MVAAAGDPLMRRDGRTPARDLCSARRPILSPPNPLISSEAPYYRLRRSSFVSAHLLYHHHHP